MKKKYLIPLILSLLIILLSLIPLLLFNSGPGFTNLFPGGFGTQFALFIWSTIISSIVGVLLGYFFAPIYLFIHRNTIGRRKIYYIEKRPTFEEFRRTNFYGIFKALFPALLILNIGFILAENPIIQELLLKENLNSTPSDTAELIAIASKIATFFIISGLGMVIPMALFSGAWILLDAGIVSKNKSRIEDTLEPVEVIAVGNTFISLFQGYAGISFVITLYLYVSETLIAIGGGAHFSVYLGLPLVPLILVLLSIPAMFIVDITWNHRKKTILKIARKIGAIEIADIEIKHS